MAIQNRRGAYVDLNPAKAVPGELLVVQSGDPNATDGKAVYITFASGDIKMLATKSDVETIVAGAVEDIVQDLEDTVDGYADRAETAATNAETLVDGAEATIAAKGAEQVAAVQAQGAQTIASIPQDYTALSDDVSDLKSAISDSQGNIIPSEALKSAMDNVSPVNLLDKNQLTAGYVGKNGTVYPSGSYKYSKKMPVKQGDTIKFWRGNAVNDDFSSVEVRFLCAYDESGTAVSASGSDSAITSYTVPEGIAFIVVSIAVAYLNNNFIVKAGTKAPTHNIDYFDPYYGGEVKFLPLSYQKDNGFFRRTTASLTNDAITLPVVNITKNVVYAFSAKLSSFSGGRIRIGDGIVDNNYYNSYITITETKISWVVNRGNPVEYDHNLTISEYINITLTVKDDGRCYVTVETVGGSYSANRPWYGFSSGKYAVTSTTTLTDCVFTVSFLDANCDTYIFGDSYTTFIESTERWVHYLKTNGYIDKVLINSRSGENSADALVALNNLLWVGKPKYLMWCLGMNDGTDSNDTPNSAWLTGVNKVISYCEQNDIIPVFATIPTTPSTNNEAKNAWIRNSGYRYVDMAKAVGATSSGVWFAGLLSSDNVHPSEAGAKALYHQVLCDFPEMVN